MKMSKQMLNEVRVARGEKELTKVLRKIVKNYVDLDREDMSVIRDIIGMLRNYGWVLDSHNKLLKKEGELNINLATISFK